ncbi:hypothetical protein FP744_10008326 [Trichoderma asperellum]|nr:CHAT domain-containing protein [Trichoderma asperelloides]
MAAESSTYPPSRAAGGGQGERGFDCTINEMGLGINNLSLDEKTPAWRALRNTLTKCYQKRETAVDLDQAIAAGEEVLTLANISENRASYMSILAFLKTARFLKTSARKDVQDAIALGRQAKKLCRSCDPPWPAVIRNLGDGFVARFQSADHGGRLSDLDEAIESSREMLRETKQGTLPHYAALSSLVTCLILRSEKTGDPAHGEEAIQVSRQHLENAAPGSPEQIVIQQSLGIALLSKYERTGYWRYLEETIRLQRLVTDTIPHGDDSRPEACTNLAVLLRKKYDCTNKEMDLREAVRLYKEAATACPAVHPSRVRYLADYVTQLSNLIGLTAEVYTVDNALREASELIRPIPAAYEGMALVLRSVGRIASRKYELSGNPSDLVKAVHQALKVASQANGTGPQHVEQLHYDSDVLRRLLKHAGNLAAAPQDNYIVLQVVKAMHAEYCKLVKSDILKSRSFVHSLMTLEKDVVINAQIVSISTSAKTDEVMKKEMADQVNFAVSLGAKTIQHRIKMVDFTLQFNSENDGAQYSSALSRSLKVLQHSPKPLTKERLADLVDQARKAYRESQKLQQLCGPLISDLSDLVDLHSGDLTTQVDLLDMTADLFLQNYFKSHDLNDLKLSLTKAKESLALQCDGEYSEMDRPGEIRCRLLCNMTHKLRDVYLTRREEEWLTEAIFIGAAAVRIVALAYPSPKAKHDLLIRSSALVGLANAYKSKYQLHGTFDLLEKAIEMVQEATRLDDQSQGANVDERGPSVNALALMMRLRYLETGEIEDLNTGIRHIKAFLGDYRGQGPQTSRGKSSLIANLGLLYLSKCERTGDLADIDNAIFYCQASVKSMQNLASAYLERYFVMGNVEDLRTAVEYASIVAREALENKNPAPETLVDTGIIMMAVSKPHATVVQLKAPGPRSVLQELPLAHVVHFACHAVAQATDLNSSHLVLMPDPEAVPSHTHGSKWPDSIVTTRLAAGRLAVQEISACRASSAELAYLSVCSAAENRANTLADESIHISSAFQLVGFKHVVGTLWQTKDRCCQEVAAEFYRTLFAAGDGDAGLPAPEALDQAVRRLRQRNPERVLDWAPFIHMGA